MLEFDRIGVWGGIDTNRTIGLRECTILITGTFTINFRFQPKVCKGCHDMTEKSMSFDNVASDTVKEHDYRIDFWFMTKGEAVKRMKNADLSEKNGQL